MQHHITLVSHTEQHNCILTAFVHVGLAHPNYYIVARLSLLCCNLFIKSKWCHHLLLRREEEERVTAKNLRQAEYPTCTENKTHLTLGLQLHDLWLCNTVLVITPHSQQDTYKFSKLTWQVTPTQKQFSAIPDAMNILLWCYPRMTVELHSLSVKFLSYFYYLQLDRMCY